MHDFLNANKMNIFFKFKILSSFIIIIFFKYIHTEIIDFIIFLLKLFF